MPQLPIGKDPPKLPPNIIQREINMIQGQTPEQEIWSDMCALWRKMATAKPTERNEIARRYAVSMTEFEKMMGYFYTFVMQECDPNVSDEA